MKKKIIIAVFIILSSCIFTPDLPQEPDGRFTDRFNLNQIVSTTIASFSFSNYRELFAESDNFFVDVDGRTWTSERFISNLELINTDTIDSCTWTAEQGGDFVSMDSPTTLNIRRFVVLNADLSKRTGDVRITVNWNGVRWQIIKWEEIGEEYSFFHPDFRNN